MRMRRPTDPGDSVLPPRTTDTPRAVEVALTHLAVDADGTLRFVAELTNHSAIPSRGVRTHWRAWTCDGRYLGGHLATQPDLPPGGRHPYVGGAAVDLDDGGPVRLEIGVDTSPRGGTGPALGARLLHLQPVQEDWCTAVAEFAAATPPAGGGAPMASLILRDAHGRIVHADFTDEVLPSRRRPGLWHAHFELVDCPTDSTIGESRMWWEGLR